MLQAVGHEIVCYSVSKCPEFLLISNPGERVRYEMGYIRLMRFQLLFSPFIGFGIKFFSPPDLNQEPEPSADQQNQAKNYPPKAQPRTVSLQRRVRCHRNSFYVKYNCDFEAVLGLLCLHPSWICSCFCVLFIRQSNLLGFIRPNHQSFLVHNPLMKI